jgi:16S rRNA G966 N2-methylase RsmD
MSEFRIDPAFESLIPPLAPDESALLEQSIKAEGCRDPLVVWNGILLDGHNRKRICDKLGVEYAVKQVELPDYEAAKDWIIRNQLGRRNLTRSQWECLLGMRYNREKKENGVRGKEKLCQNDTAFSSTAEKLAAEYGVSPRTVHRAAASYKALQDDPEALEAVMHRSSSAAQELKRVKKEMAARKLAEQRQVLAAKADSIPPSDRWSVLHTDLATFTPVKPFDFIITDPPYPKEFLPLYTTLAEKANEWLAPGGLLVAMCGQSYLDTVMYMMSLHLEYYWTAAYLTPGMPTPLRTRQVNSTWKPLLMFTRSGETYKGKIFGDVFKSEGSDKRLHEWGQSESGMSAIVTGLCLPGQSVLDPFCGAGTTGVAALRHGCLFTGLDVDETAVDMSRTRLAEEA